MTEQGDSDRVRRAVRAGGPPAVITAAIGGSATGIAGQRIEGMTAPVARDAAQVVGVAPELGPSVLLVAAVLILAVALIVPSLFEGHHL